MSYNFKETMNKPERLAPGHRMCAGCGGTIAVRNVLRGLHEGDKAVIGNATGCLEVSTFTYPYTAWEDSYIHNAFENEMCIRDRLRIYHSLQMHLQNRTRCHTGRNA